MAPASIKDIKRSVRQVRSSVRGKVHKSVYVRVNNICDLVEQLLPRANELGEGSPEFHLLTRTATEYLPDAVNRYLAVPRDYAERVPMSDGRTAIIILCAQLDRMYSQLYQVVEVLVRRDGDKLLANERFLEDKFGSSPLNLPPDPPRAAQSTQQHVEPPSLSKHILQATVQLIRERMQARKSHPD